MTDNLWRHILTLKSSFSQKLSQSDFPIHYTKDGFVSDKSNAGAEEAIVTFHNGEYSNNDLKTECLLGDDLFISYRNTENSELITQLKTYCPLIFGGINKEKPFVIVHMAQTMDGKICTNSGNSKWIGNQENLVHSHRVRALVDGVLVGGKTLEKDLPRLNVRLVEGDNPTRVLFSNRFNNWDQLPKIEKTSTILLRSKDCPAPNNHPAVSEVISYAQCEKGDNLSNILTKLKTKGIDSLLIEGGATTAGAFISEGLVDVLQFHIAPMIFGSGKSCISLPEIKEVKEGWDLKNLFSTSIGDAIMITGELVNKKQN